MKKIRKPRVLLTGFTPFGGETVNPALEAVKRVRCPEVEVRVLEVPTVFGESSRVVTAAMDAFRPDVVLCVGQAAGRSAVTPERVAINVDDARIPDNAGQQPVDAPIETPIKKMGTSGPKWLRAQTAQSRKFPSF